MILDQFQSHLATGKFLEAAALPEKVLRLEDPGTKALAVVEAVAAIAKSTRVFFIAIILSIIGTIQQTLRKSTVYVQQCDEQSSHLIAPVLFLPMVTSAMCICCVFTCVFCERHGAKRIFHKISER